MPVGMRGEMLRERWLAAARIVARKQQRVRRCPEAARRFYQTRKARPAARARAKSRGKGISSRLQMAQRSACTGKFKRGLSHGVCDLCRRYGEILLLRRGNIGDRDAIERVAVHVPAAVAHELSAVVAGADVLVEAQACGGEEAGNFVGKKAKSPRLANLFEGA